MENLTCEFCKKTLEENFNFCPYCGEPLTDLAKEVRTKQASNNQLKIIFNLLENVEDEKTISLLNEIVAGLKEKM